MKKIVIIIVLTAFLITSCSLNSSSWFSKNTYTEQKQLLGYRFKIKENTLSSLDFTAKVKNPLLFSNWQLLTKNGELISFSLEDIDKVNSSEERKYSSFDFSEQCSTNLFYVDISNYLASILIDYDKNILMLLENSADYKEVKKAVKFNNNFKLSTLQVVGAYYKNNNYITSFIDENNVLYQFNLSTLEFVKSQSLENLEFISAYAEREYPSNKEHLYIYLQNKESQELIKRDLAENKEVYTRKINTNIEGEITEIEVDLNVNFVVSKQKNNYLIYSIREKDNCILAIRDEDDNGNEFTNIDNLIYYGHTAKDLFLIVFDKTKNNPFKVMRAYGTEWIHVR